MFKKDDKVKVIKGIKAFEGLTGTVLDTNGSQVKVKLNISEDAEVQKNIINIFEDYQLELESLDLLKEEAEATFDNDETEKQVCCICGEEYTGYGNNAEPYKEGRCCDECNMKFVIPYRLNQLRKDKNESLKLTESDNEKYVIIKPFTGNYYDSKNGIYVPDLNKATTYDSREEALRVADWLRTRHESSRRRINSQGGNDIGKLYLKVVKRKFKDENTTNESLKLTEEELKAWCSDNDANYYTQDIKNNKVIIRGLKEDLAEYDFKTKELKVFDYSGTTTQDQDLEDDYDDNYIRDYVYDVDMLDDKEYPSWEFVSVIATAENISDDAVMQEAHDRGFKVFLIQASNYEKFVVAAEKITEDDIMEDFASYLEGNPKVTEII